MSIPNKNRFSKKSGEINTLVLIILGGVTIIFVIFLLTQYMHSIKEKLEIQNCKNSIAAHSMIASDSNYEIFTDIKCPTRYKNVDANDFTKAKRDVAEDMTRCWYEWGEGKGPYFADKGYFCHVCSVYTFKPAGKTIPDVMKFLASEPASLKFKGGNPNGISYQDYMQGYTSPHAKEQINVPESSALSAVDMINTSTKYAVVFFHISGKDEIQEFLQGKKTALTVGGATTIMLGTAAVVGKSMALGGIITSAATTATVNIWNPVGWIIGGALAIGLSGYMIYEIWFDQEEPGWFSVILLIPYDADNMNSFGCDKSEANQLSHTTP